MTSIMETGNFQEQNHTKKSFNDDKKESLRDNQNSKKNELCGVHTTKGNDKTNGHNNLSEMSPRENVTFPKNIECEVREKRCDRKSPGAQVLKEAEMTKDEPQEPRCENEDGSRFSNDTPNIREKKLANKHVDISDVMNPVSNVQLSNIARESRNSLASDSFADARKSTPIEVTICADSSHQEGNNVEPIVQNGESKKTAAELQKPSSDIPSGNISCPRSSLYSSMNMNPENEEVANTVLPSPSKSNEASTKSNKAQSVQTKQPIYKLAYDENLTDKSSSSPSPLDPELHMPYSVMNNDIIIHAVDTDSDDGYEDLDMFPRRYENECFINQNKHVYINRLSLAAELLRAGEKLPYDAIIITDNEDSAERNENKIEGLNSSFKGESYPLQSFEKRNDAAFPQGAIVTDQSGIARLAKEKSDISSGDSCGESPVPAKKFTSSMGAEKICAMCCLS